MDVEVGFKFYIYQIIAIFIIWGGMTWFLDDITGWARIIYYFVTSWLLFLIVVTVKRYFMKKQDEKESKK